MENEFWDKWYEGFSIHDPSNFANYCLNKYLKTNDTIVEIGCGNGRDGNILSNKVNKYIGLDACPVAVKKFQDEVQLRGVHKNISVIQSNFCQQDFNKLAIGADRLVIYSRFSLHSITYSEFENLIKNIKKIDDSIPWIFLIEARTIFDDMYGIGDNVGLHEFRTDHYRRFIDPKFFLSDMAALFDVRYFEVGPGFAKFGDSDPVCLRASIHSNR